MPVDYHKIITMEAGKRSGQPCIRGMRITVYDVLEYLAGGMTEAEIRDDFPELTREDILACYAFAAEPKRRIRRSAVLPQDAMPAGCHKTITMEAGKRSGQPCIRGMRITVYDVLEYLAGGMTEAEIRDDFPYLTREDILACYAFAAEPKRRVRHPQSL